MSEALRSYSTAEIARRLGISPQTVQRWVDSGRLKAWKTPGGHRRIDARSAEALFSEQGLSMGGAGGMPDAETPASSVDRGASVVIVDDDPIDRALMVALVELALPDARVCVASNGFQGLLMIARCAPDILITDVHMPHMDGLEMVRNVLADAAIRPRLLIAVSAKSQAELTDFGALSSDVVLMQKPVDRHAFIAALSPFI